MRGDGSMAKRGGDNGLLILGASLLVGWVALSWLKTGRGENNSPLIPDAIEDPIDRVVATLNNIFGQRWVTAGLNALQAQLQVAMPGVAGLVDAVYQAEQNYGYLTGAGKKQVAVRYAYGR
jgi:hypothetical protein